MPADKHSFHLVLASGEERDVTGDDATVNPVGALVITGADDRGAVVYAPGAWVLCEPERRDDHG